MILMVSTKAAIIAAKLYILKNILFALLRAAL